MDKQTIIKSVTIGIVLVVALGFALSNVTSDTSPQAWFYDVSEARLFQAPLSSIPPLDGVGGESGDGVEAIVVAPEGQCGSASARKIAYLQTYTDEYKRLKQEAAESGVANQTGDRAFQADNTLVKRVKDSEWVAATSPEGEAIVMEFNQLMMAGESGVRYRLCKPGD